MRALPSNLALALTILAVTAFADPKAYDVVQYRGKAAGLTITFDFADGYPEASELRISEAGKRKSRRFVLDGSGEMRFVPEKNRTGGEEVILKMSMDDGAPDKVEGVHRVGGKTNPFALPQR
jgi:hypothetical protein